ncbi:hypothetical protein [Ktedonobacter racemifer]|uniref:Uncharacterized protein n=1 Tax=Ktedonobacter racemifer DSM 44963 TaxID=485913 RepID=D6U6A7_KTERA|nr:hypothetical protein [Ktedonobacter racemifer]EFH80518.1 hypothetical protein Krac_1127 [Ktedonobacter racemifer DSM 44963]
MLVNRLALRYEPLTQTHSVKDILAEKDAELRQKQREIDRLYGKLAAASPLTDAELRQTLAKALQRLAQEERQGL